MGRWEPDARGRLERAAHELFTERGFDATTAADIAQRAGLAERTFFRHYAEKREVLFAGSAQLQDLMVAAVASAPDSAAPLEAVAAAVYAAGDAFEGRRERAVARQALIASHPELQERELIKLSALTGALAGALRARGVADPTATMAAEAAVMVFRLSFERWVTESDSPPLHTVMRESFAALAEVTAGR